VSERQQQEIRSMILHLERRIGAGATLEWIATEMERIANQLRSWRRASRDPGFDADAAKGHEDTPETQGS